MVPPTESMGLSRASCCLSNHVDKMTHRTNIQYKRRIRLGHKPEDYILFKYFTGAKYERGLAIMKHGFRAAGVRKIKAKYRQLILAELLISSFSEACIKQ